MAVEIKYVVIREGEEKMSFASKKEADAYDKMLDLAEVLNDWLVQSPLEMDDVQRDTMAMWLAERKEALQHILRVGRLPEQETPAQDAPAPSATAETSPADDDAVPHGQSAQSQGSLNAGGQSLVGRPRCCRRTYLCASLAISNIS